MIHINFIIPLTTLTESDLHQRFPAKLARRNALQVSCMHQYQKFRQSIHKRTTTSDNMLL